MVTRDTLQRFKSLAAEKQQRATEALRLFRPMPHQSPFFTSKARKRVVRGGNRSGKSTSACIEFASAVTGLPTYDAAGNEIPYKWPTDRPTIYWVIGFDLAHIGKTIFRLLFQAGVFKIIKDKTTGEWRSYRAFDPEDKAREAETKMSPPLIPKRFIKEIGWEDKKGRAFKVIRGTNVFGHEFEIRAFPSTADQPPQGDQIDGVWIDEDIKDPNFIIELEMRLIDRAGRLFWSAWPHSKNFALRRMSKEAAECKGSDNPHTEEVQLRMSDNSYLDAQARAELMDGKDAEEIRARDYGDFLDDTVSMYPTFSPDIHGIRPTGPGSDKIDEALNERNGEPPAEWTRYLILDPGHVKPAVMFAAVPHPSLEENEHDSTIVVYDELALHRVGAEELAKAVATKVAGYSFEKFIIDSHGGQITPMASAIGHSVQNQYAEAFRKVGLTSRTTGSTFQKSFDGVVAGCNLVRNALTLGPNGRPRLRFYVPRTPHTCEQITMYQKWVKNSPTGKADISDEPAPRQKDDLCDCLRYLVADDPIYRAPEPVKDLGSAAYRLFQRWMKRDQPQRNGAFRCGALFQEEKDLVEV